MEIIFNGQQHALSKSTNIQEFLDQLHLDCLQVVVEHNHKIVPRQRFLETILNDGDILEVVHFVGGG